MAEFTSVADPSPVEHVEVATLALARDVGIRAAKASLARPDTLFRVAVVERFDRGGDGSSRRRHLSAQSFIGASKRDSDPRFCTNLGDGLRMPRRTGSRAFAELEELHRHIPFSILGSSTTRATLDCCTTEVTIGRSRRLSTSATPLDIRT